MEFNLYLFQKNVCVLILKLFINKLFKNVNYRNGGFLYDI